MHRILILLVAAACAFAADDPFLGLWKCNFQKSRTTVASPPPQPVSMTLRYEKEGDRFRITAEAVTADGQSQRTERTVRYGDAELPRTPNSPPGDVVINRRLDRKTEEIVYKRDGKVTSVITRIVSQDGKTLTYTAKTTGDDGKPNETIIVYERQ